MSINEITALFNTLAQTAEFLSEKLELPYLEALLETSENIIEQNIPKEIEIQLTQAEINYLKTAYNNISIKNMERKDIRKSFQLALLKGMREEEIQPNHQMTPDTIGQLISYFIQLFYPEQQQISLLDFGSGTGNLLSVVSEILETIGKEVEAEGIEVDETLISLAAVNFALQEKEIKLTHQDVLSHLLVEPVDVITGDLPVGYYPNDQTAARYEVSFTEGHSYSHYLMIEQGMKYLKENGLGIFLVPDSMFEEETSSKLIHMIQKQGYLQVIIHLPKEWFQSKSARKNMILLQKKGKSAKQPRNVLFANAPDFKNPSSVKYFLSKIKEWKETELDS